MINHSSGRNTTDWETVIRDHFKTQSFVIEFYRLPEKFTPEAVQSVIQKHKPDRVIAVGGDGTVNLLASLVKSTNISLGILPAGSANGMARELGIAADTTTALNIIEKGITKRISVVEINDRISLHLSDVGLNAYMLREFETRGKRGLLGYIIATLKVFRRRGKVRADIHYDNKVKTVKADMILIANATTYGTGVVVNPVGTLDDNLFEVIAINELTVGHVLKSSLHTLRLDESKAEIFQASKIWLHCKKPEHFQVDGEYLGKIQDIKARLLPKCVEVIVPPGV